MPEIGVADQARVFPNMDTQDLQDKTQPIQCILCIHVSNGLSSDFLGEISLLNQEECA